MEIKELIEELVKSETSCSIPEVTEKLFSKAENVNKDSGSNCQKAQIEQSAVNLWNWTVARKVISDMQRVKLRHVACKLMMYCEVNDPPEEMIRRQILMNMKTGKGWVDVGKPALADELFEVAMNNLEKLYSHLSKRSTSDSDIHIHKADVEKDVFKVLSFQAESAVAQAEFEKAVACVQQCKDILLRLPKETCYLSLLCYNFGVETYELKRYEQSSFWLSQSYDIGKMDKTYSTGQEMQAKVLRLLATVYLDWDCKQYQEKALRAVTLANEENLHPAGLFLKIKILLKAGMSDEDISTAIAELLNHDFSLNVYLDTAKLLLEHEREVIGFDFLKSVTQLFEGSPDVGKVILLHIELLLLRKEWFAKKMIEDIVTGHKMGKHLPSEVQSRLHLVLWDRAATNYEEKAYSEALQWYSYSLSFYSPGQIDQNLAKLHRNMAACYLHLKEPVKANEAVKEAERCDPNSIFTQFYIYKIAVLEKDTQKALNAIVAMEKSATQPTHQEDKLSTDESMAANLLSLAAQFALENNQQPVAIKALEYLSQHLKDWQQTCTALKCLIRLVLSKDTVNSEAKTSEDMKILLKYLTTAHHRLDELPREETTLEKSSRVQEEAQWFRKIAWNLAVQCESCPVTMRDLFLMSFKFSQFCPRDKAVLLSQRTCLLMAAAVDLDLGRSNSLPVAQQAELWTQALEHIQSCREIWRVLKQMGDFHKDPTDTILLLYEFEARTKLNDPAVGDLLDQVSEWPEVEIKTLETIASLAMETPAYYPSLCKRALNIVLHLLKKQGAPDISLLSKCLHSLVHLSLPPGITEADAHSLEEAWGYFEDALSILDNTELQASYPEVETLWLMTRAWNTGIFHYCASRYQEAEQWCGLGMHFLGHLGSLKSSYEGQMVAVYSEVLSKLDRARELHPKEE